jgi:catechol 2,3-dioxygenase-like lactoylglutathione lyase family enzyme
MTPALLVEVITLPVSDLDRAVRFYVGQVGFALEPVYWRAGSRSARSATRRR